MQQPTASIVDALIGEETCPLCFDIYSAVDACTCVVCSAASCPSCAETVDVDGAQRCFACRPARVPTVEVLWQAGQPLSLPRPIAISAPVQNAALSGISKGPPPLPFPLTTSPRGVRTLKPRAPGSVFVGLPPVPPVLQSLRDAASEPSQAAPLHLSLRVRARLQRLVWLVDRFALCSRRGQMLWLQLAPRLARYRSTLRTRVSRLQDVSAQLQREARTQLRAMHARMPGYREKARALAAQLPSLARAQTDALLSRLPSARARIQAALARIPGYRQQLRVQLARVSSLRPKLALTLQRLPPYSERLKLWLARVASYRAKLHALTHQRQTKVARVDPSRPIQL